MENQEKLRNGETRVVDSDKKKALVRNGNGNEVLISENDPIFDDIPDRNARFNGNQSDSSARSQTDSSARRQMESIVESPVSDIVVESIRI